MSAESPRSGGAGSGSGPSPSLVSVVLPTRNRLEFLREAVGSVLAQTHRAWELLAVDAASTDGSAAYLASLRDPRIRVVPGEAGANPARLRNAALARARGTHVAFLDSDDLWEPRKLELHLARMEDVPEARWSYSAVTRIDERGAAIRDPGLQPWRPFSGRVLPELLAMEALVATPAVVAERSLIRAAGGFDEDLAFCEDYDLWFRLAALGDVVALPERLARVRVHDGSYSADRAAVHGGWVRVYEKAAAGPLAVGLTALCRERRRHHAITRAALLADRGERRRALREIAGVLVRNPSSARAWRVLVGRAVLGGPRRPHRG